MLDNRLFFRRRFSTRLGCTTGEPLSTMSAREERLVRKLELVNKELALIQEIRDLPLAEFFARLIAARDGIDPKDVTPDYVLKRRRAAIYPRVRYREDSAHGGYHGSHLISLTREEIDAMLRAAEERQESLPSSS